MEKLSPVLALMKEYGAPLTRDEFLKWNSFGKTSKVTPEEEVELPNRFQYPVVSHEEMPKPKSAASGSGEGKSLKKTPIKHFNGKLYEGTRMSGGAQMDTDSAPLAQPKMDISNPAKNQIEPNPMVPREQ